MWDTSATPTQHQDFHETSPRLWAGQPFRGPFHDAASCCHPRCAGSNSSGWDVSPPPQCWWFGLRSVCCKADNLGQTGLRICTPKNGIPAPTNRPPFGAHFFSPLSSSLPSLFSSLPFLLPPFSSPPFSSPLFLLPFSSLFFTFIHFVSFSFSPPFFLALFFFHFSCFPFSPFFHFFLSFSLWPFLAQGSSHMFTRNVDRGSPPSPPPPSAVMVDPMGEITAGEGEIVKAWCRVDAWRETSGAVPSRARRKTAPRCGSCCAGQIAKVAFRFGFRRCAVVARGNRGLGCVRPYFTRFMSTLRRTTTASALGVVSFAARPHSKILMSTLRRK